MDWVKESPKIRAIIVKAGNDRSPRGKRTNKKTRMGSWRVYAFQMENSGLIQISMKSQRYFESAVAPQFEGELRFRHLFPLQRTICGSLNSSSCNHFFLHSQFCQEKPVLSFRHPNTPARAPYRESRVIYRIIVMLSHVQSYYNLFSLLILLDSGSSMWYP
jgi:hypothetical protein